MGFSTSGSLLIVFFALLIGLGTMYSTTSNTTDHLSDAYSDQLSLQHDVQDTRINVTEATWHTSDETLTIRTTNAGATDLSVDDVSVLIDGEFRAADTFDIVRVEERETKIWDLREELRLENETAQPDRVKVVTGVGVADRAPVTPVGLALIDGPTALDTTDEPEEESIEFDIDHRYDAAISLQSVTIVETDTDADVIDHREDPEVQVWLGPDNLEETETIATGRFDVGEQLVTDEPVALEPDEFARYRIGEFREDIDETSDAPIDMDGATVTIAITYEDPHGVERTHEFETEVNN